MSPAETTLGQCCKPRLRDIFSSRQPGKKAFFHRNGWLISSCQLPSNDDSSNEASFGTTPSETPGTSRVPTRDSQSSLTVPTKSQSPHHPAPTSEPVSKFLPPAPDDRPHQVKFILSDSPVEALPTPPKGTSASSEPSVPDPNDPYRWNRRTPQTTNPADIPDRFHFEKVTKKRQSQQLHYFDLPVTGPHSTHNHHRHRGGILHNLGNKNLKDHSSQRSGYDSSDEGPQDEHAGSQVSLRRFFRGVAKKSSRPTTPVSPSTPPFSTEAHRPSTPPSTQKKKPASDKRLPPSTMPFGDDHAGLRLTDRYGKFGKVLGAGAGGSVRLMKRASDGTTFAVKEFRPKGEHETQREYAKKVNAEFTIGSILSHQNIIETLDIVNEGGRYFEVMEYCRYDLVCPFSSNLLTCSLRL